ncbi:uncharacterized protein LOC106880211 [Octopus bimaculoides]|uniref:Acid-sensing ion channel 1 n=1 Tax=Octopus bimaculoides TaxID=37653 RepID=A0A0L8I926_OCTBM|nr:uncharacterized protein LOC106880211 [Octopus bimaculoides]|eukprot:XP_014785558.1 PREDICTED: uncharacterized protein LOC106880211 [Octopus bimaculoides]
MTSVRNRFEKGNVEEGPTVEVPTDDEKPSSMFLDFAMTCSLHGLKNAFSKSSKKPQKVLWLLLLMTCIAAALFQILDRILYFYQYPVSVLLDVNYNDSLLFPTITICNQNKFRATEAYKLGIYRMIENVNKAENRSFAFSSEFIQQAKAMNISERDLRQQIAHTKEDMIIDCHWSSERCAPENFTTIFTDEGVCYSFNTDASNPVKVASSGTENGLRLTLNVEQYEYMSGGQKSVGIKVLFHNSHDVPTIKDLGLASATGTNSFFGLQVVEVIGLPKPRGVCEDRKLNLFYKYSRSSCEAECITYALVETCGCRLSYMPKVNDSVPLCSLVSFITCYIPQRDKFHSFQLKCDCPLPCNMLLFDPSISYTAHSENKVSKLIMDPRMADVKQKLINAKEVKHRMDAGSISEFRNMLLNFNASNVAFRTVMLYKLETTIKINLAILQNISKKVEKVYASKLFLINYQKYLIEKNFERPWEAIAERTFHHVSFDFFNYIYTLKNMFLKLDEFINNSSNQRASEMLIHNIKMNIETKLNMVEKAEGNFTEYYQSLTSGVGIFRYRYLKVPRSHNFYAVPKQLLTIKLNQSKSDYSLRLSNTLISLKECLFNFSDMLDTRDTGFNLTKFTKVSDKFIHLSKLFNSIKSVFNGYTTKYALGIIKSKAAKLQTSLTNIRQIINDMNNSFTSLQIEQKHLNLTSSQNVFAVSSDIIRYLTNTSVTKISLAAILHSPNHVLNMMNLQVFMEELRERNSLLHYSWTKLNETVALLWQCIIQDRDSYAYYEYANYTKFSLPLENVTSELHDEYADYQEGSNVAKMFGTIDRDFFYRHKTVKEYVTKFKERNTINDLFVSENILEIAFFYKQLSYEIITDQVAYDFFSLMCDTGGALGLLLGSSILTIFELADFAIGFSFQKLLAKLLMKKRVENL